MASNHKRVLRLNEDLESLLTAVHREFASILIPQLYRHLVEAAEIVHETFCDGGLYIPGYGWPEIEEYMSEDDPTEPVDITHCVSWLVDIVDELPERTIGQLQWDIIDKETATLRPTVQDPTSPYHLVISYADEDVGIMVAIDALTVSDHRYFVPVLVFHETGSTITFLKVQRYGITACTFDVNQDPILFTHLLLAMFCSGTDAVGFDNTIHRSLQTDIPVIYVQGVGYDILERLTGIDGQLARGTHCFKARSHSTGDIVVIKDFWHTYRSESCPMETEMLERVSGIPGVPTFIGHEIVRMSNQPINAFPLHPDSDQVRMVSSPFALPLHSFQSLPELLYVLKDINVVLYYLRRFGLLHGDISPNNILIEPSTTATGRPTGLLIDFGYSRFEASDKLIMSGTPIYVAEELQPAMGMKQTGRHDIESLFYVILSLCVRYTGPGGQRTHEDGSIANGLPELFQRRSTDVEDEELGDVKRELFFSEDVFEQYVLATQVTPHFSPLKPLLRELRELLFSNFPIDRETIHMKINEAFERCERRFIREDRDVSSQCDPTEWLRRNPWASVDARIEAGALTLQYPTDEPAADAPPFVPTHQGLKRRASRDIHEDSAVKDLIFGSPISVRGEARMRLTSPPKKKRRTFVPLPDVGNELALEYPSDSNSDATDSSSHEQELRALQMAFCVIS